MTDIEEFYGTYRHYIKSIARGHHDAFMCVAPHGLGKSYQAVKVLENEVGSRKYHKFPAVTSPFEFYKKLWELERSSVEVLFMDDIEGLLRDDRALSILKQATWSESGKRVVGWNSSDSKLQDGDGNEIPQQFVFTGRVIMIFNEVPEGPIFDSLKDRCFYHEMDFSWEQRCEIVRKVARKGMGEDVDKEQRTRIAEYLIDVINPSNPYDLNLRTMEKALKHFNSCSDIDSGLSWQEVVSETINHDEVTAAARDIVLDDQYSSVAERKEAFKERTGKCGRTYLRRRNELKENSEVVAEKLKNR